ncbi:hypothetical protein [Ralstonia wenshanensis]|uniref:hypothetical protein n=1 Tax=Ralstonia wenshanensis TaxID=2842456 RepID=UPI003D98CA0C
MNCKPGELAIIIKTPNGEHIGAIVEVKSGNSMHPLFGYLWNVRFARPVTSYTTDENGKVWGETQKRDVQCPDEWLRPLRGELEPDERLIEVIA